MVIRSVAILACVLVGLQAQPARRPLALNDFDRWRSIASQQISADGKWLAYSVFPQVGDGEVILVNLSNQKETRIPCGALPIRETVDPNAEPTENPVLVQGPKIEFTPDAKYVVFLAFPPKTEVDAARKAKKKPEEMPKNNLTILPTFGGSAFTSGQVKSFQLGTTNSNVLAYQKDAKEKTLVIRQLSSGNERSINETGEYSLSKDGQLVVYTVDAKQDDINGLYLVNAELVNGAKEDPPTALAVGKGKYAKLTWNEEQTLLAVATDQENTSKLLGWRRGDAKAEEWVSPATEGFRPRWQVSTKGNITFSSDSKRIFFGTTPPKRPAPKKVAADAETAQFDLWHWKEDQVQSIQKVRTNQLRDLSYPAVYHLDGKTFVQLADLGVQRITPNLQGDFAFGSDDRAYRISTEWDEAASDIYFIDSATGQRSVIARKLRSPLNWAPDGRKAVYFDGRDWILVNVKDTNTLKLTTIAGVRFDQEDDDHPRAAGAYGVAGWTKDSEWVLLYDKYDVWQFAVDGSTSRMMTRGEGRANKIQMRYEPLTRGRANGLNPGIDMDKPLLLRGESQDNYSSGFWSTSFDFDREPVKLLWGAKNYKTVLRAADSDAIIFSASTFKEMPDLYMTDSTFTQPKKLTTLTAQVNPYEWGSAELIEFRNMDGTPLKALLEKPANFDPTKKYPMIVYIYEKRSNELNTFATPRPTNSINASFYTSNGYVVLQPDIVYKTGSPGQSALQCVMPAVDAAVRLGFIDEANIGIQGHSWGGYQIAYMVTKTNRFKAASAGAPVANMTSAYDGIRYGSGMPRQFQYERTQSRIGGSLWEYPMRYLENSPVFAADRVETPLLMIHNDGDDAVPWTQGIEFFLALRRNGKEAYLFNYNGEPHNLRKRVNQKDYTMRLKQYFDFYLKGASKPDWMERGIPYLERN